MGHHLDLRHSLIDEMDLMDSMDDDLLPSRRPRAAVPSLAGHTAQGDFPRGSLPAAVCRGRRRPPAATGSDQMMQGSGRVACHIRAAAHRCGVLVRGA